VIESTPPAVELDELISLFYPDRAQLGDFAERAVEQCAETYRRLLAHQAHMTVTVERRHRCEVDVEVLASHKTESHYLRKIILRRKVDGRVVQFGIVRLALAALQPDVRDEIMAQKIPLGRVLINHNVMRHVQLNSLWQVACGPELCELFGVERAHVTYARTALIYCDGEPAVELLEIVAPDDTFA
jgi:chorismate-pyruvate lyase